MKTINLFSITGLFLLSVASISCSENSKDKEPVTPGEYSISDSISFKTNKKDSLSMGADTISSPPDVTGVGNNNPDITK